MRRYTMRLTWIEDAHPTPNDYEFCCDGKSVGRCYLTRDARNREVWRWTVYGVSSGDIEDTLAEAQARFKETFEAANLKKNEAAKLKRPLIAQPVERKELVQCV